VVIFSGIINNIQSRNFTIKTLKLVEYNNSNQVSSGSNNSQVSFSKAGLIKVASLSSFGIIDMYYSTSTDSPALQANSQMSSRIIVT
jgi:hypothetical protein